MRAEVEIEDEDNAFNVGSKRQTPKNLGPMDKFVNPIDPKGVTLKVRQQNLIDALDKERTYSVHQYCARWKNESCISFHSIDNDGFKKFVEAIGQYGRGKVCYIISDLAKLDGEKRKLRLIFTSDEWTQSKWAKTNNGKGAYSIIVSPSFWNEVNLCLKVISVLVKVLRLADGDEI
ncbi:hypothetical protein Tco_1051592 [Tanacetum coccineum]